MHHWYSLDNKSVFCCWNLRLGGFSDPMSSLSNVRAAKPAYFFTCWWFGLCYLAPRHKGVRRWIDFSCPCQPWSIQNWHGCVQKVFKALLEVFCERSYWVITDYNLRENSRCRYGKQLDYMTSWKGRWQGICIFLLFSLNRVIFLFFIFFRKAHICWEPLWEFYLFILV